MWTASELQKFVDGATISRSVFELRPDYLALLIAIDGITPSPSDSTSDHLLSTAETAAKTRLASTPVTDLASIKAWRNTYKSFGAKPKKYQSSIESLTRRTTTTGLPRVNRLTDIYNAVSVLYGIPIGGEDLDAYKGFPRLVRAHGTESFVTRSATERPEANEVVWCDGEGVTCRNWNWRQCVRTGLTEDTRAALFILDGLQEVVSREEVEEAGEQLVRAIRERDPGVVVAKRVVGADEGVEG